MPDKGTMLRNFTRWVLPAALMVALAGCTGMELAVDTAKRVQPAPEPEPTGVYKVGKPYKVEGQWYYPKIDYSYSERGVASWYGPNFHGKLTANGEIFDMRKVTAAHKTLPLPSVVRVTNLENGRSLVLRVNDRGPFVSGRIIDLSKRAAELLGFADKGTAMVEVQIMVEESRQAALAVGAGNLPEFGQPPPAASPSIDVTVERLEPVNGVPVAPSQSAATPPTLVATAEPRTTVTAPPYGGMSNRTAGTGPSQAPVPKAVLQTGPSRVESVEREPIVAQATPAAKVESSVTVFPIADRPEIFVQAGAFARYDNANRLRARLASLGHPVKVTQVYVTNQPMFRVRVGPLNDVQDADLTLDRIIVAGYPDARIVID